ncbi:MAG: GNAT family N-acetyltransferase [Acidimicrobiales bacterium]
MIERLHLRPATTADLPAIALVYRAASLHWDDTRQWLLERPEFLAIDGGELLARLTVVAERDGELVGFASCTRPLDGRSELEDLFVLPDRMGGGVGRALVDAVANSAVADGAVVLDVTANSNALGFYEAVGFRTVGSADTPGGPAPRMVLALDISGSAG